MIDLPFTRCAAALSLLLLVGCPPTGASDSQGVSGVASASESAAKLTEGESDYVPPGPGEWKPGEPYPIPDPLPAEAIGREVSDGPAPKAGEGPIDLILGGKGDSDGRFGYPRAMTTTADGTLFVADKTGRIQKFSPEGKLLAVVRAPGVVQGKPTGLGIDRHGDLILADTHYCRVLVYGLDLKLKRAYGAPGRDPGQFMMITSVQAGADGKHYTTDFGDEVARVQVFREDGTFLYAFGAFGWDDDQFRRPMNLAVDDEHDRLYVADAANHRIAIYTREGKLQGHLGGEGRERGKLGYPYDVKLDEQGRVWVAEFGNQRISVFARDGTCVGVWGKPGRRVPGLNRPWAVALGPNERVWALDSNGNRCYGLKRSVVLGGPK